jgi:hypothetical protein
VRIQYPQLTAAKVSNPKFRGKCGNFLDISKGISQSGMCKFESSEVSQAFRRLARLAKKSENGPEIPAFRAFNLISGLVVRQSSGANRRKSPAVSADIPVLRRLWAETGLITTAARGRQSFWRTGRASNNILSGLYWKLSQNRRTEQVPNTEKLVRASPHLLKSARRRARGPTGFPRRWKANSGFSSGHRRVLITG